MRPWRHLNPKLQEQLISNAFLAPHRILIGKPTNQNVYLREKFQAALNRQLGYARKRANSSAAERERRLADFGTEIDRMVAAVVEGLLSPALRTRLEAAEAERARLRAATQPQSFRILSILPDALARYEKAIRELPATLGRDVDRAWHALKRLLGEIKLRVAPEGDALLAEIRVGSGALLRPVSNDATEICVGSGGRLCRLSSGAREIGHRPLTRQDLLISRAEHRAPRVPMPPTLVTVQ